MADYERTLTTAQAARMLGVGSKQVITYIRLGRLAASETPGGHHRLSLAEIEEFKTRMSQPEDTRARIICFTNQKGGVGKTTLSINIAVLLSQIGKRILIVDMDPQAHATFSLGVNADKQEYTIYDAMLDSDEPDLGRLIQSTRFGPDLAAINEDAHEHDQDLSNMPTWGVCLSNVLESLRYKYDYILIDTGPHFDKLLVNALIATDYVVIPTQLEMLSVRGLNLLRKRISAARKSNARLQIAGVVSMMVQPVLADQSMAGALREALGEQIHVYNTTIPRSAAFKDVANDRTIMAFRHPRGEHTLQYRRLLAEILRGMGDATAAEIDEQAVEQTQDSLVLAGN